MYPLLSAYVDSNAIYVSNIETRKHEARAYTYSRTVLWVMDGGTKGMTTTVHRTAIAGSRISLQYYA